MALLRGTAETPSYGPGGVQLGPLRIDTACPLQMPGSMFGLVFFYAPCAVTVKNTGREALLAISMEETGTIPSGKTASPPASYQVQADGVLGTLAPGQTMTLPAPKSGYTGWVFVSANPQAVHRNMLIMDAAFVAAGAGTLALGYYLGRRRSR